MNFKGFMGAAGSMIAGGVVGGAYGAATDRDVGKSAAMGAMLALGIRGARRLGASGLAGKIDSASKYTGKLFGESETLGKALSGIAGMRKQISKDLYRFFPKLTAVQSSYLSHMTTGAVVGGALGGVHGAISEKRTTFGGMIRGAIVGALAGAGVRMGRKALTKAVNPIKAAHKTSAAKMPTHGIGVTI